MHKDYILREVEEREDVARARCVGSANVIHGNLKHPVI